MEARSSSRSWSFISARCVLPVAGLSAAAELAGDFQVLQGSSVGSSHGSVPEEELAVVVASVRMCCWVLFEAKKVTGRVAVGVLVVSVIRTSLPKLVKMVVGGGSEEPTCHEIPACCPRPGCKGLATHLRSFKILIQRVGVHEEGETTGKYVAPWSQ